DVDVLLRAGADKVGINTAAIARPDVIDEVAARFGSQVLVLSVDVCRDAQQPSGFEVTTHGGRCAAGMDALDWVRGATERGIGEVLLNSMDADGTRDGFDVELIAAARDGTTVPLIARGGACQPAHFCSAVQARPRAVLAASVFHFGVLRVFEVKDALRAAGHPVR